MQEQPLVQPLQKEIQNPRADLGVEVECAIHELEMAHAPRVKRFQFGEKGFQRKRPGGLIQRRQAEFAAERTTARGFDVDQSMGDVLVGIEPVGQGQLVQRRRFGGDDALRRRVAVQ